MRETFGNPPVRERVRAFCSRVICLTRGHQWAPGFGFRVCERCWVMEETHG